MGYMTSSTIFKDDDGYFFCDDDIIRGEYDNLKEKLVGFANSEDMVGYHQSIKSALYDDMTGYIDKVQDEEFLPWEERYFVEYFKYDKGGLGQLVDWDITKSEIIANVIAQKYVEGARYFLMKDLRKETI